MSYEFAAIWAGNVRAWQERNRVLHQLEEARIDGGLMGGVC